MASILLIEPDSQLALNISDRFRQANHHLAWRVSPQSAINYLDKHKTDLVILDLVLAGRSGIEFLYEFRSYPEWRSIPVIIYSHISADELANSADYQALGISNHLHKPVTKLSDLVASVEEALITASV